jgi:hypothetical protein
VKLLYTYSDNISKLCHFFDVFGSRLYDSTGHDLYFLVFGG